MYIYKCKSVRDLFRHCQDLAMDSTSGRWFFRGQCDSRWTLRPSLLRKEQNISVAQTFESEFLRYMRKIMADRTTLPERVLDDPDILLAIGQHYGVGTRLLDWTLDPAIALYFAVSEFIRQPPERRSDEMSVFAMAEIYLNIGSGQAKADLVFPPRAANPNLVAQKGLLTKIAWNALDLWDQDRAQLTEDPVDNLATALLNARLIRLDLPQAQASAAMKILFDAKIDASVLFPSHHGLVRTAEDLVQSGRKVGSQQFDRTLLYVDVNDKGDG